jgi:steroid delta-isomerase-like uncharacterized protein
MNEQLIRDYFTAFNIRDIDGLLALLDDSVEHHTTPGGREVGKPAFRAFLERCERSRDERVDDLEVMVSADGRRAAAEYTAHGTYRETEAGLPAAENQAYALPGGCFFLIVDGLIMRITRYDNLPDWLWREEDAA